MLRAGTGGTIVAALLLTLLPTGASGVADAPAVMSARETGSVSYRQNVAWAEVRSDQPRESFWKVRRDLGSGRRAEGVRRSYYVFDVGRYAGTHVVDAQLVLQRTSTQSCRRHGTSVHLAGPVGPRTTWRSAPDHGPALYVSRLVQACDGEPGRVEWDVTAGLQELADAGAERAVLMVRSSAEDQRAAYQTHARRGGLQVHNVSTPNVPSDVEVNGQDACGTPEEPVLVYDSHLAPTFRFVQSSPERDAHLAPVHRATDLGTGQALPEVIGIPRAQGVTAGAAWVLESGHTYEWTVASRRRWQEPDLSEAWLDSPEAGPCYFTMQ